MKIRRNSLFFLSLGLLLVSFSCKKVVFEESVDIESAGWLKSKPAIFDVDIQDISRPYSVMVSVENGDDYRYSNVYMFVDVFMPTKKVVRDTVDFILANQQGKWTGSGLWAPFRNEYPFKKNVLFPVAGRYRIVLEQAMRCDSTGILEDITQVGIRIEKE